VILDSVGYYDVFPPKQMSVSTKTIDISDSGGAKVLKRILIAERDFTAGETIYKVMRHPPALRNRVS
jgi:import receptor subunit TOM20